jgi:hypothetical protein
MLKLMMKKAKAEEDAKQWEGNWEKLTVSLERLEMSSKWRGKNFRRLPLS